MSKTERRRMEGLRAQVNGKPAEVVSVMACGGDGDARQKDREEARSA